MHFICDLSKEQLLNRIWSLCDE